MLFVLERFFFPCLTTLPNPDWVLCRMNPLQDENRSVLQNLEHITSKLTSKYPDKNSVLKELYSEIKQLSHVYLSGAISFEEQEHVIHTLTVLLTILNSCDTPAEVSLLSGTCLVSLVYQLLGPERGSAFLISLLNTLGQCYHSHDSGYSAMKFATSNSEETDEHTCFSENAIHNLLVKQLNEAQNSFHVIEHDGIFFFKAEFPHLVVLHGILSCKKADLISHVIRTPSHSVPLIILIFHPIAHLCSSSSQYLFHSFQLLWKWIKTVLGILEKLHSFSLNVTFTPHYFSSSSKIVDKILVVLEANWENPINHMQEAVRNIYKCLFEAHLKECSVVGSTPDLVLVLLQKTAKLSWHTKGKYIVLSSLLQFTSYEKFLEMCPDAPSAMISNIKLNYVASIIGEVYRLLVSSMQLQHGIDIKEWYKVWGNPITDALTSDDMLLLQNIKNYILPWTFKILPASYTALVDAVRLRKQNDLVEIVLLRIAKDMEVPFNEDQAYSLIEKLLHHSSELLRMEAFTFLCSSPRKSEAMSSRALQLIMEFFEMNFNIDDSAFNQRIMSQTKLLLTRIRDSTALHFGNIIKKKVANDSEFDVTQIRFVQWLTETALDNTFPGACYQRRRTSLQILNMIYDRFFLSLLKGSKKEHPSANVNLCISWAQERGLWKNYSDSLLKIFPCLSDFTDDIRLAASNLLQEFFPWPEISCQDDAIIDVECLLSRGLDLCNSYHVRHADTGSLILHMLFVRYVLNKGIKLNLHNFSSCVIEESRYIASIDFLLSLVEILQSQMNEACKDFFNGVSSGSVHGIILAIHRCMVYKDFLKAAYDFQPKTTCDLIQKVIEVCHRVVDYMLIVMTGKANVELPSFAEIGQALNDVLCKKGVESQSVMGILEDCSGAECCTSSDSLFSEVNIYSLTPEFQLLLSCCWQSIKNSCFLVSELLEPILCINIASDTKLHFVEEIVHILSSTLLKCRHRGVIEACSGALSQCCKILNASKCGFEFLVVQLLYKSLDSLLDASSTSVTRRSAGLPLLIQAVVGAKTDHNGNLVSCTIKRLLEVVNIPLCVPFDDTKDLPQAHAFHILRILTSDTSLSQQVFLLMDKIVPVCITGFSSKSWAIRNGALQLYGVLLPRLCGQKKTKEDISEHNMILPTELFMRCPNLYLFLLKHLQKSITDHRNNQLCPELLPLLCLISKLSPHDNSDMSRSFVIDFQPLLIDLLASPSWHVRNMASTSLSAILASGSCTQQMVLFNILSNSTKNNEINGILLTLQKILQSQEGHSFQYEKPLLLFLKKYLPGVLKGKWCDMNILLLLDISALCSQAVMSELKSKLLLSNAKMNYLTDNNTKVNGVLLKRLVFVKFSCSSLKDLITLVENYMFINQDTAEAGIEFLEQKWSNDSAQAAKLQFELLLWQQIMFCIVKHINNRTCNHFSVVLKVLKLMVHVCSDPVHGTKILDGDLALTLENCVKSLMDENCGISVMAWALTTASLCLKVGLCHSGKSCDFNLDFWIMKFYHFSHSRKPEILRFHAAEFIAVAGCEIVMFLSNESHRGTESATSAFMSLCNGSLHLLQDEVEEIRKKVSAFPSSLPNHYSASSIQFNAAIMVVYQLMSDVLSVSDLFLQHLWFQLQNFPSTVRMLQAGFVRKCSLFEQEYVNVFAEPVKLTVLQAQLLQAALEKSYNCDFEAWLSKVQIFARDVMHEIKETNSFVVLYTSENSTICLMEYVSQPAVYLAFVKLICQSRVICSQQQWLPSTSPLHSVFSEIRSDTEKLLHSLPATSFWICENLKPFVK